MVITDIPEQLRRFEIPGRITLQEGNGEMCKAEVTTDWSSAEIYLHGAQVTDFRKKDEAPLLFLSQCSQFAENHPIRGGVPLVFPWFGAREGMPAHGFARLANWNLHEVTTIPEGGVSLRFSLPETSMRAFLPPFLATYVVTVTDRLTLELLITNASEDEPFAFETCFHTYYAVGNVSEISIHGLQGVTYLDSLQNMAAKTDPAEAIRINAEVDRIYYNTDATVSIHDPVLRRKIVIEKAGSASTVVWNPWHQASQQMPDFGNDEHQEMVCVESGNVGPNRLVLAPGKTSSLRVTLGSEPL
jgi:glucose-6-phosphate 1-epimerase